MKFGKWIHTLMDEKMIDMEDTVTTCRGDKTRELPIGFIVEHMIIAPADERADMKKVLVMIDFKNGDVLHFIAHLGAALWEAADEFLNLKGSK
jgi:hypothetical protein